MSLVGDVGDLGDLDSGDLDKDSEGDSGEATGEEGEGEKTDSSLGVLSILIMGGAASTDFDLFPPRGDGDLDLLILLEPKLELLDLGI